MFNYLCFCLFFPAVLKTYWPVTWNSDMFMLLYCRVFYWLLLYTGLSWKGIKWRINHLTFAFQIAWLDIERAMGKMGVQGEGSGGEINSSTTNHKPADLLIMWGMREDRTKRRARLSHIRTTECMAGKRFAFHTLTSGLLCHNFNSIRQNMNALRHEQTYAEDQRAAYGSAPLDYVRCVKAQKQHTQSDLFQIYMRMWMPLQHTHVGLLNLSFQYHGH